MMSAVMRCVFNLSWTSACHGICIQWPIVGNIIQLYECSFYQCRVFI